MNQHEDEMILTKKKHVFSKKKKDKKIYCICIIYCTHKKGAQCIVLIY